MSFDHDDMILKEKKTFKRMLRGIVTLRKMYNIELKLTSICLKFDW